MSFYRGIEWHSSGSEPIVSALLFSETETWETDAGGPSGQPEINDNSSRGAMDASASPQPPQQASAMSQAPLRTKRARRHGCQTPWAPAQIIVRHESDLSFEELTYGGN
jgi:hypothetical protein